MSHNTPGAPSPQHPPRPLQHPAVLDQLITRANTRGAAYEAVAVLAAVIALAQIVIIMRAQDRAGSSISEALHGGLVALVAAPLAWGCGAAAIVCTVLAAMANSRADTFTRRRHGYHR
ncbi:hypothetical protein [Streptomyces sp. NPDC101150]|uniref:hypothetical protein n=1 Tax=Streptomyces sp. NPDC101150 TaxID=3366114 RepID=UPI0038159823